MNWDDCKKDCKIDEWKKRLDNYYSEVTDSDLIRDLKNAGFVMKKTGNEEY